MRCEQARELLPAYLDQPLEQEAVLEVHLATCRDCAAELGRYRSMLEELGRLRDRGEPPPPELVDRVLVSIPDVSVGARLRGSVRAHPVLAAGSVGAAALGAATVVMLVRRRRSVARAA